MKGASSVGNSAPEDAFFLALKSRYTLQSVAGSRPEMKELNKENTWLYGLRIQFGTYQRLFTAC